MSLLKIIIIALFLFIFVSLFQALRLMHKGDNKQPMSKFLGRRLLFSVSVFIMILVAVGLGIITPNPRPY